MIVYLMQHGRCTTSEEDPDRPLTEEGRREVLLVAHGAAASGFRPERVFHSGKTRARQSAEILAQAAGCLAEEMPGLAPNDPVGPVAERLEELAGDGVGSVALVGHLPSLDRIAARLVVGDESRPVVAFRNGALVRLVPMGGPGGYRVDWVLCDQFAAAASVH